MVGSVRPHDQSDPTAAASKRTRASATQVEAFKPASKPETPNAAEDSLIRRTQQELLQSYEKAKTDRAAAQRKANEKARVAAEQARVAAEESQTLRKNTAAQAETDLYSTKTQALRAVLEQVAQARAAGRLACVNWPLCIVHPQIHLCIMAHSIVQQILVRHKVVQQ